MRRRSLLQGWLTVAIFIASAPVVSVAAESPITLTTPTGTLQGTLMMPDQVSGRIPVALVIAGSGPTNRDGSNPAGVTVTPYRQLAAALAARGIATVRYDKRGIAASAATAPLGKPVTFFAYVDDVAAWVRMLRGDSRFSHIVLAGHSEGSLLALLAASKISVDGVISLEGAGRPAGDVIVQQIAATAPSETVDAARRIVSAIKDGKDPGAVPVELVTLFPPYLQTYEQQWFSSDPAQAARAMTAPLLVVQGGADIQIPIGDANLLADAHSAATLRIFPAMTHVLMDAKSLDRAASIATYTDTSLSIDPKMVDAVAAFVAQRPVPGG